VNFTQIIRVRSDQPDELIALAQEWDALHAIDDIVGYMGQHVLCDRDHPGEYLIVAEFGIVDPDISAADEALKNDERPITQEWAERLRSVIEGEPEYRQYDEIYRTG
jgi:hypothetical protein